MDQTHNDRAALLATRFLDRLSTDLAEGNSQTLRAYLEAMSRFHRYSFNNSALIQYQRPEATQVAGFGRWKKLGRHVKKGERGILILAPCVAKVKKADRRDPDSGEYQPITFFTTTYVFDVAQTEGAPLPDIGKVEGEPGDFLERLKAFVQEQKIELGYQDDLKGAQGVSLGGQIKVLAGLSPAEEFQVLVHELAHEMLHRGDRRAETDRQMRELEAEAVAYAVTCGIGIDNQTASWDYIRLYGGNPKLLAESLTHVHQAATSILRKIA